MSHKDYLAVIAIDFGTTFSGYAFSMRNDKDNIKMNKSWGAEVGFQSYKTPTTILLNPDGSLQSFGFQAENEFTDLDEDDIEEGYLLFQRFKMELFNQKDLHPDITIQATNGEEHRALDIIAESLKFIKKHCLDAIAKTITSPLAEEFIRWVLTVPAIWSDTAKKFMRLAAVQAGLTKDMLSEKLVIALEPEAASLYCRTMDISRFIGKGKTSGNLALKPGERYIVVDCGGGTIDVTIHEEIGNGKTKEVQKASGGPWGGIYVDKKYFQLLDDIFGKDFMNTLKQDQPATWLSMLVDFETKKRAANPDNTSGINMSISLQFAKSFEKHAKEDIIERIKKKKHMGVKFSNGMLRISADTIRSLYSDVIPEIRNHLERLIAEIECRSPKMFIVGGFGESAYIQEFLKSEFEGEVDLFIPDEAGMCVMKGAVLFGHDTRSITSRIARCNYGIVQARRFDPRCDKPDRLRHPDDKNKVYYVNYFVRKNQRINLDEVVEHTAKPGTPDEKMVYIELVSSDTAQIDDPDDPACRLLGTIDIESPNVENRNRKVKISLHFGGTDILLKAVDVETGNEVTSFLQI